MNQALLIRQEKTCNPSLVRHSHNRITKTTTKKCCNLWQSQCIRKYFLFSLLLLRQQHSEYNWQTAQIAYKFNRIDTFIVIFAIAKRQWHWPRDNHWTLIYHRHYHSPLSWSIDFIHDRLDFSIFILIFDFFFRIHRKVKIDDKTCWNLFSLYSTAVGRTCDKN